MPALPLHAQISVVPCKMRLRREDAQVHPSAADRGRCCQTPLAPAQAAWSTSPDVPGRELEWLSTARTGRTPGDIMVARLGRVRSKLARSVLESSGLLGVLLGALEPLEPLGGGAVAELLGHVGPGGGELAAQGVRRRGRDAGQLERVAAQTCH